MKKLLHLLICATVLLCVTACGDEKVTPIPEPPIPDNPVDPDEPIDPYADIEDDWQDQTPFFILTDVQSFTISNINEDGFIYDQYTKKPFFTQDSRLVAVGKKSSSKNANKPFSMHINFDGVKATPFKNREAYAKACLEMGIRPYTTSNIILDTLKDLPTYTLRSSHMTDHVTDIQIFCDQVWFAGIAPGDNVVDKKAGTLGHITEKYVIAWYKNPTSYFDRSSGFPMKAMPISWYEESKWNEYMRPYAGISLVIADEPGIYTMKLRLTFSNGTVYEQPFKVRIEPEGYEGD